MKVVFLIMLLASIVSCQSTSKTDINSSKYNELNRMFDNSSAIQYEIKGLTKKHIVIKSKNPGFVLIKNPWNGDITEVEVRGGVKHGKSDTYGSDSLLGRQYHIKSQFIEGVEHGIRTTFANKKLSSKEEYECGIPKFHTGFDINNGQKIREIEYVNGTGQMITRGYEFGQLEGETESGFQAINHISVPKFAQFDIFTEKKANRKRFPPKNGWQRYYDPKSGRLISETLYIYGTEHGEQYRELSGYGMDLTIIANWYLGRKTSEIKERNIVRETYLTEGADKYNKEEKKYPLSNTEKKKLKRAWLDSIKKYEEPLYDYPMFDNKECLKVIGL